VQLYRVLVGATLLLIVFAFSPPELVAQENEQLIGSWRGGLEVGGGTTLTLVLISPKTTPAHLPGQWTARTRVRSAFR